MGVLSLGLRAARRRSERSSIAATLAAATFIATAPAKADPYQIIRWRNSGFCQAWDQSMHTQPMSSNYDVILGSEGLSFDDTMTLKDQLLQSGEVDLLTIWSARAQTAIDAGAPDCYPNPTTYIEIINACTDAEKVVKNPVLPLIGADGKLPPLP